MLDAGAVGPGDHEIVVDISAPGGNLWNTRVLVDDREAGRAEGWPVLFPMAPFEGIDVGLDRRSPVSWALYQRHGAYPYSGTITSVTYTPGTPAPDAPVNLIDLLRKMGAKYE